MNQRHELSRRSFVRASVLAAALPLGSALAGCAPASDAGSAAASSSAQAVAAGGEDVLVAFFSATGNTREVAEKIAAHFGADLFEIEPVEPYTEADLAYGDDASRTSRERVDANRAVELVEVTPPDFDAYRTVFVGYPIWWGGASWVVDGFVTGNDFTGKTVVPFCTSGSSPIGSSGDALALMAGSGDWVGGARFAAGASESEVAAWVDDLGL